MTVKTSPDVDDSHPLRRTDVVRRETPDETLLYDPQADAVHVLNRTALAVWDLCDGEHAAGDIEAELRRCFKVDPEAGIAEDVRRVLERFNREQLLKTTAGEG